MENIQKILLIFTIIGAINWGLVGLLNFDLVSTIFGTATFMTRLVYSLVGVAGIVNIGIFMARLDYKKDI